MLSRSSILSVLLVVANITVMAKIYLLWRDEPWEIPQPSPKVVAVGVPLEQSQGPVPLQLAMSTKSIIDNDLFDPERGNSKDKENETTALATQKVRSMILTGTMIIGESRYAIFQEGSASPSDARPKASGSGTIRLKLGDTIEGFRLSEIDDRRVAFNKGSTHVEIGLDYFRKIDGTSGITGSPQVGSPQTVAQAQPLVPRRERLRASP